MLSLTAKERQAIICGDGYVFWTFDRARQQIRIHFMYDKEVKIQRTNYIVDKQNAPTALYQLAEKFNDEKVR